MTGLSYYVVREQSSMLVHLGAENLLTCTTKLRYLGQTAAGPLAGGNLRYSSPILSDERVIFG